MSAVVRHLTAGCVCTAAPLWCGLGCCPTAVVNKATAIKHLQLLRRPGPGRCGHLTAGGGTSSATSQRLREFWILSKLLSLVAEMEKMLRFCTFVCFLASVSCAGLYEKDPNVEQLNSLNFHTVRRRPAVFLCEAV